MSAVVAASVADLDHSLVAAVLVRHSCNVTDAAAELSVPASDLRRLLWANPGLQDASFEVVEARIDKAESHKRAVEALALVGLANRAEHYPSQMSGGQQQRVAVARALVNRPSILLADEPTGNLDSRTSVEIMEVFQDLNDKGLTIVMVTHEHDIAQFAKRVMVFRDGKIRKDDPVVNRPRASEVLKTLPTLED